MEFLRLSGQNILLFSVLMAGMLNDSLCYLRDLQRDEVQDLKEFVGSKLFLQQFLNPQQLYASVFDDGFKVSVVDCVGVVEEGYPQYVVALEISIALEPSTDTKPTSINSKNTAIVSIAEHEVLGKENETVKTSSSEPHVLLPKFCEAKKYSKFEMEENTENEKANFEYTRLSNVDDSTLSAQSSANCAQVDNGTKRQKRIFATSKMVWDPVFKIGLVIATALKHNIFPDKILKDLPVNAMADCEDWIKKGMPYTEECPEAIVNKVKAFILQKKVDDNFRFTTINYFVRSNTDYKKRSLHVVTLRAEANGVKYLVGAVVAGSEDVDDISLTSFLEEDTLREEKVEDIKEVAENFRLPTMCWSMKQVRVPLYKQRLVGILKKLTNTSDSPCTYYRVMTSETSCDTYNFKGYMEVPFRNSTMKIEHAERSLVLHRNREDMFKEFQEFAESFPAWVTKMEPHLLAYPGLGEKQDKIRIDYLQALSNFCRNDFKQFSFKWEFLTEATLGNEDSLGSDKGIIVVHAMHIFHTENYYETKYSLTKVSNTESTVVALLSDPKVWFERTVTAWKPILSRVLVPLKVQVVWSKRYPEDFQPKNMFDKLNLKNYLQNTEFCQNYDEMNKNRRESYGYHKLEVDAAQSDVFVIYRSDIANSNPIHYKYIQLRLQEKPLQLISVSLDTVEYKTLQLAQCAVETKFLPES